MSSWSIGPKINYKVIIIITYKNSRHYFTLTVINSRLSAAISTSQSSDNNRALVGRLSIAS